MPFKNVRMPPAIAKGAQGGPEFQTRIVTTGAGIEYRESRWSYFRGSWNVAYGVKTTDEWELIYSFFVAMKGRLYGFRFRDYMDYTATDNHFGDGDGVSTVFPLYKRYEVEEFDATITTFMRRIVKPAPDADFHVYVDGVEATPTTDYSVNYDTGVVTFVTAPAADAVITWTGQFDVPARFDTDKLNASLPEFNYHDWPDIPVVELNPLEVTA